MSGHRVLCFTSASMLWNMKELSIFDANPQENGQEGDLAGNLAGNTAELALTARQFGAAEAHSMGLVSRVLDGQKELNAFAHSTAATIRSKSPLAVQGTKHIVLHSRSGCLC